jgi:ribosome-associated protein
MWTSRTGGWWLATKLLQLKYFCNRSNNKDRLARFLDELEQATSRTENKSDHLCPTELSSSRNETTSKEQAVTTTTTTTTTKTLQLDPQDNVHQLVEFLHSMNAVDPCLIDVRGKTSFADYLVVASGRNSSHISFMTRQLSKQVQVVSSVGSRSHRRPLVYGRERSDWIAVDMDRIVVHCMLEETRQRYQIEQLWLQDDNSLEQT